MWSKPPATWLASWGPCIIKVNMSLWIIPCDLGLHLLAFGVTKIITNVHQMLPKSFFFFSNQTFFLLRFKKHRCLYNENRQKQSINNNNFHIYLPFTQNSFLLVKLDVWPSRYCYSKTSWKAHCGTIAMCTRVIQRPDVSSAHSLSVK